MSNKFLERTKKELLREVRTSNATVKVKKVFYYLIKRIDLYRMYSVWYHNGRDSEGFQYMIIDYLKENTVKYCKDVSPEVLDEWVMDIVFTVIPV